MANLTTPTPSEYSNTHLDPVAGFLSYLIPGLGQIKRGKVGKGILFFVCIHCLFFWGLSLGHLKNVYLPRADDPNRYRKMEIALGISFPRPLWNRIPFVGQFWVGIAAWPALIQWYSYPDETSIDYQPQEGDNGLPILGTFMRTSPEAELNQLQTEGDKVWELGWIFTVIAGALNLLVIFDAFAGPTFPTPKLSLKTFPKEEQNSDSAPI